MHEGAHIVVTATGWLLLAAPIVAFCLLLWWVYRTPRPVLHDLRTEGRAYILGGVVTVACVPLFLFGLYVLLRDFYEAGRIILLLLTTAEFWR